MVSDVQAQTTFRVGILEDWKKLKDCKDFEEDEGRINTDLLSRLIIVGGPLVQAGPTMQATLVHQVFRFCISSCRRLCEVHYIPHVYFKFISFYLLVILF